MEDEENEGEVTTLEKVRVTLEKYRINVDVVRVLEEIKRIGKYSRKN